MGPAAVGPGTLLALPPAGPAASTALLATPAPTRTGQDFLAYLRLAVTLQDDVALARIVNTPRRGLGDASLEKLHAAAAARGGTLSQLLFGSGGGGARGGSVALPPLPDRRELGLAPKAAAALEAFRELIAGLHATVASKPLDRALAELLAKVRCVCSESFAGWAAGCRMTLHRRRSHTAP